MTGAKRKPLDQESQRTAGERGEHDGGREAQPEIPGDEEPYVGRHGEHAALREVGELQQVEYQGEPDRDERVDRSERQSVYELLYQDHRRDLSSYRMRSESVERAREPLDAQEPLLAVRFGNVSPDLFVLTVYDLVHDHGESHGAVRIRADRDDPRGRSQTLRLSDRRRDLGGIC